MPLYRRYASKMSDAENGDDVTVVDVYDIASDIGKECEIIIDKYGAEALTSFLPKVINALELLENLATRNERENSTLQDLHDKISQLENDKLEKAEYRQRFEKELEIIEEQWRSETAELVTAVTRLQEENRRLARAKEGAAPATSATQRPPSGCGDTGGGGAGTGDENLWRRMGEMQEQHRNAAREKDALLQEKQKMIEGLTSQVKRLAATSREVRRKQKYLLQQMRVVCNQRAELEADAQARQRELVSLRQALATDKNGGGTAAQLAELLKERDQLREQLEALQKSVSAEKQAEPLAPDHASCCDEGSTSVSAYDEDSEPPVQGPLPCEPDDAPWKRQPSGIRKFFRKLFSEYDVAVGSFPGRSLSSLTTKMAGITTDK